MMTRTQIIIGLILILVISTILFSFAYNQEIKIFLGMMERETMTTNDSATPAGIRNYAMMKASCNNNTGHPDGDCFMKSFEKCESARIKQSLTTIEGDPIFFYATIVPENSCTIQFVVDSREDKYSDQTITERTCQDAQLLENSISFRCGDDVDRYGFSLR